ncbi:AlbA family DNA-binding domain-containing protein [Streptomyces sanyensis]
MAVVVEPVVTEEKLRELLAEASEQRALDYKEALDLSERRDLVDIAKDVAAMQAEPSGGYLVIGADDHGTPTGRLSEDQTRGFDEATLRPKLRKYIQTLTIHTAAHCLDGKWLVLLYVAPSADGCCVFQVEGTYQDGKKQVTVFRAGDVFVRHGTSSERWKQSDVVGVWQRAIASRKETWRRELRQELEAQGAIGEAAQHVRQRSVSALTWQLDQEVFDAAVLEYLRAEDDIPLRQFLLSAPAQARELLTTMPEDLPTLLNRVASFTALSLVHERTQWVTKGTDSLLSIYNLGNELPGSAQESLTGPRLWLSVLERVYGLGGLAVRLQDWPAVRMLADRRGTDQGFDWFGSWLRHGLTTASRAGLLASGASHSSGLIAAAHNTVREVPALHPDASPDDDAVLNSLCQFDALGALVVMGAAGRAATRDFYTNFARYMTQRTEPALVAVTSDAGMRQTLFDGSPQLLEESLKLLVRMADEEGFRFNGWTGVSDPHLQELVYD